MSDVLKDLEAYKSELHVDSPLDKLLARTIEEIERLRSLAGAVSHDNLDFASIKNNTKNIGTADKPA